MLHEITELTIYEDDWLRGKGSGNSALFTGAGTQCCLGQYLEACGVPRQEMLNIGTVAGFFDKTQLPKFLAWLTERSTTYHFNSAEGVNLMTANDDIELTEEERKPVVAAAFGAHGVHVTFAPGHRPR